MLNKKKTVETVIESKKKNENFEGKKITFKEKLKC